jgi:hypothetical protein
MIENIVWLSVAHAYVNKTLRVVHDLVDYIVNITVIRDWLVLATITVKLLHVMLYPELYNCFLNFQILSLHTFGVHGGVCGFTRKLVDVALTTLITGSPFGLGSDPELKVS